MAIRPNGRQTVMMNSEKTITAIPEMSAGVIWKVSREAGQRGFTLAWRSTHTYKLGFVFIACAKGYAVMIRAKTHSIGDPLSYTFDHCHECSPSAKDAFIGRALRVAAEEMCMHTIELDAHLAQRSSLWEFEGFCDRKPDKDWPDNSTPWRALWGRIVEADTRTVEGVPPEVRDAVYKMLKSRAASGQIVLDR